MQDRRQTDKLERPSGRNIDAKWLVRAEIAASHQDLEGSNWQLGLIDDLDDKDFLASVRTLVGYCDHPNIFFDPAFLAHSSKLVSKNEVRYLFLTETFGDNTMLRFFAPITIERVGKIGPRFVRVWSSEFAPLGIPLVDRKDMERTVEELCICFSKAKNKLARGILIPTIPARSRFAEVFERHSQHTNKLRFFNPYQRACIRPLKGKSYLAEKLSGKRRQRLKAGWRKLSELGEVRVERSTSVPDVEMHVLDFLFIEQRSWKGRQKTAMMSHRATRDLATGGIRDLSLDGKCEVFSLYLDDIVIASVIFLNTRGHYTVWKTTYHERYSSYSAGNLIMTHATEEIAARKDFRFLDSVATGDNTNANHIWTDRLDITSIAMEFGNSGGMLARQIARNLSLYIRFKLKLKALFGR